MSRVLKTIKTFFVRGAHPVTQLPPLYARMDRADLLLRENAMKRYIEFGRENIPILVVGAVCLAALASVALFVGSRTTNTECIRPSICFGSVTGLGSSLIFVRLYREIAHLFRCRQILKKIRDKLLIHRLSGGKYS